MPPHPHMYQQLHQQRQLHSLTPNACLLAVLLITRSSSGPALTFHYPQRPRFESPLSRSTRGTSSDSSSDSSSSGEDDDADETSRLSPTATGAASDTESRTRYSRRDNATLNGDDDKSMLGRGKKYAGTDTVLGFKYDFLAGLLAPGVAASRGRFEMSVDDVVFLGAPVHVRPDGTWRKRKKRRRKSMVSMDEEEEEEEEEEEDYPDVEADVDAVAEGDSSAEPEGPTMPTTPQEENDADDERDDGQSKKHQGTMNMFHVVFVLNPPELEYHYRTAEIFEYVVKRFSRALKYEQAKDGYVWREADKIARMKERAAQNGRLAPSACTRANIDGWQAQALGTFGERYSIRATWPMQCHGYTTTSPRARLRTSCSTNRSACLYRSRSSRRLPRCHR